MILVSGTDVMIFKNIFGKNFLMVGGLSQRPNLTGGPAATWDLRRSIKEEEKKKKAKNSAKKLAFFTQNKA
jgi:hypothetical protein